MKFIPEALSRNVGRKILTMKKNSPHIFFAAGVAGVVTGTVLACKATLKLEEALDEVKHDLDSVKSLATGERAKDGSYTQEEYYKDLGYVYAKGTVAILKLYGPSLLLGIASIGALTGAHVQLTRRNTALTATLALVSQAFEEYRVRVQEEVGVERELDIYQNATREEVEGSKELQRVVNEEGYSPYARFFDEASTEWTKIPESNRVFLQLQQNYANHKLRSKGHVFLNEVYDSLGLERSQAGSVVGWLWNGDGDNFIDFGMFDVNNSRFINGIERSILLDFNVDGIIYNKI